MIPFHLMVTMGMDVMMRIIVLMMLTLMVMVMMMIILMMRMIVMIIIRMTVMIIMRMTVMIIMRMIVMIMTRMIVIMITMTKMCLLAKQVLLAREGKTSEYSMQYIQTQYFLFYTGKNLGSKISLKNKIPPGIEHSPDSVSWQHTGNMGEGSIGMGGGRHGLPWGVGGEVASVNI